MYPGVDAYEGKVAQRSTQRTNAGGLLILLENKLDRAQRYFATMGYQQWLVLATLTAITFISCKKEEEERAPVVTIVSPSSGFALSVPDTLNVVADVSGEGVINRVTFTVTNASGIPVLEPLTVFPASNPVRLEVGLPITSEALASGGYTLTVRANSGEVSGKDERGFDIVAAPLRLRRVLAIGQPDAGSVSLEMIDSSGTISLASTLVMDLGGAAVSSAAQTFVVAGSIDGPLTAFRSDGVMVQWQKPNLGNSGIPWFTSLDVCDDGRFYVGTTDGLVRGYNATTGGTERVCALLPAKRAQSVVLVGERLLVAQADQLGAEWRITVHQASSGAMVSDQAISLSVVAMFRRNDGQVLLFGDRDGSGVVKDHNIQAGGGWEPYSWNARIAAVERVDANTFLVALADGAIERFNWSTAASVTIANIVGVHDLAYDQVSGMVLVAAASDVITLDPQTGDIAAGYAMGAPVRLVLPLLNR